MKSEFMYGKILQEDTVFLEILPLAVCLLSRELGGRWCWALHEELQRWRRHQAHGWTWTQLASSVSDVCLQMGLYLNQLPVTLFPEPDLTAGKYRETGSGSHMSILLHLKQRFFKTNLV